MADGDNLQQKRSIVDVSEWDSCNVGSVEGASLTPEGNPRRNRVSSMRSSLFQKSANKEVRKLDDESLRVFANDEDAAALRLPLQFADSEALKMCTFGRANKKNWTKDIFAISHNAVRCEIGHIAEILDAIKLIAGRLTVGDLEQFRVWWESSSAIMLDYLEIETKVFLPWIHDALRNGASDECSAVVANMPVEHSTLRDFVEQISMLFNKCISDSPRAVSQGKRGKDHLCVDLVVTFDRFITKILKHMHQQETCLPDVLSAHYKNEKVERDRILELIITETVKCGRQPDLTLVLHTRWMSDAKGMKAYLRKLKECYDCSMSRLQSQFELNHGGTIAVFKVKAGKT